MDLKHLDEIMARYNEDPVEILSMLMEIQEQEQYLPREALFYLAKKLALPVGHLYRLVTFYEALSLKPQGRHQFHVCTGTACHVRGASFVQNKLESLLGIRPGEVTPDGKIGLKTVNCVGACALGPVVVIDGVYHGSMTSLKVNKLLKDYA
jgi:NADH-quinone oxidoreductase subunit E